MSLFDLAQGKMGGSGSSLIKGAISGLSKQLSGILGPTNPLSGAFPDSGTADISSIEQEMYALNPNYQVTVTYAGQNGTVTVVGLLAAQSIDVGVSSSYSPFSQSGVLTDQLIESLGEAADIPGTAKFGNKVLKLMGIRSIVPALTSQIWEGTDHISMTIPILFIADQEFNSEGGHSVLKPVSDLMKMAVPRKGEGGFLDPPGPLLQFKGNGVGDSSGGGETGSLAGGSDAFSNTVDNITQSVKDALKKGAGGAVQGATNSSTLISALGSGANAAGKSFQESTETINNISVSIGQFLTFGSVVITGVNPSLDMTLASTIDGRSAPMFSICTLSFMSYQIPTDEDIDALFNQLGMAGYGGSATGQVAGSIADQFGSLGGLGGIGF